jgi:hypothetical protein
VKIVTKKVKQIVVPSNFTIVGGGVRKLEETPIRIAGGGVRKQETESNFTIVRNVVNREVPVPTIVKAKPKSVGGAS